MDLSGNSSLVEDMAVCYYIYVAWTCTYLSLVPVFFFVLCVGFQRCRKPRSRPSATPHSDVFTFNMAALEVGGAVGYGLFIQHFHTWNKHQSNLVQSLLFTLSFTQTMLHILVCSERYLAVVHPITYLRLKKKGVAIRNVSIALVSLLGLGAGCIYHSKPAAFEGFLMFTGVSALVFIPFLCASVLYVLIGSGPGDRRHVDQSKRRAFHTVAAITAALMLKYVPLFVAYAVFWSQTLGGAQECMMAVFSQWFYIPTSLVLPTLFLYRRNKQHKTTTSKRIQRQLQN